MEMTRGGGDYPDSERFNPERFLKHGQIDPSVKNPMESAFGFGRRYYGRTMPVLALSSSNFCFNGVCPGRHNAHSTLQLTAAAVLSTFNLVTKKDELRTEQGRCLYLMSWI